VLAARRRGLVAREQARQLVPEGADAGRLQPDHRGAGPQFRPQHLEGPAPQRLGRAETPPVVQGTAAAHRLQRHDDRVAQRLQHFRRGDRGRDPEEIVEGVRPQHDAAAAAG
jgi:hypothetical protein